MDLEKIPLFSSFGQKMKWLNERQKVLAQNIANADTPGYHPKDLKKISFTAHLNQNNYSAFNAGTSGALSAARSVKLETSHAGHMAQGGGNNTSSLAVQEAKITETSLNGNSVNLEDELIKMANTQMDYTMAVNLYKKHVGMMKIAIGKRG